MSAQDITDAALRFLEIIAGWPIVLLLVVLILRRAIKSLLPPLARRVTKASLAGASFEFGAEAAVSAFQATVQAGIEEPPTT